MTIIGFIRQRIFRLPPRPLTCKTDAADRALASSIITDGAAAIRESTSRWMGRRCRLRAGAQPIRHDGDKTTTNEGEPV